MVTLKLKYLIVSPYTVKYPHYRFLSNSPKIPVDLVHKHSMTFVAVWESWDAIFKEVFRPKSSQLEEIIILIMNDDND